jgi:hypothetical protein
MARGTVMTAPANFAPSAPAERAMTVASPPPVPVPVAAFHLDDRFVGRRWKWSNRHGAGRQHPNS